MSWASLVRWLALEDPADQKECGQYVLGELDGDRRAKDTVLSRSVATLDADAASKSFHADSAAALRCAAAFHTTWRHTPESPRWRLLVPLSRDVTPVEYTLLVRALMEVLGAEQFDLGSQQPERYMFKPSTQDPGTYDHHIVPGDPLDVEEWLARALELGVDRAATSETPSVEEGEDLRLDLTAGQQQLADAEVARFVDRWMSLLTAAANWTDGHRDEKDRGWEQLTRDFAWAMARLAASQYNRLTVAQVHALYDEILPGVIATNEKCRGKFDNRLVEKAAKTPAEVPGWLNDFVPMSTQGAPLNSDAAVAADAPLQRFPRLALADLLSPNRPVREWVVNPFLAAGTSVALIAPAGHRKSLVALRVAVAVSRGEADFAGMEIPRARRVVYVDMENTEDDLRERLLSFGLTAADDLERFILLSLPSMRPLDTAEGGRDLLDAVAEYGLEKGDLVVLDSYQRVTENGENDSDTTRGYYRHTGMPLKGLGLTVIRTDNTGKDASKGARGSSGKRDDVDVEYLLQSKGEFIEIATGKTRQRGVGDLEIRVYEDNGITRFSTPGQAQKVTECVALMDQLGLADDASARSTEMALKEAKKQVTREAIRAAVVVRKKRAESARRAFATQGDDEPRRDPSARSGAAEAG